MRPDYHAVIFDLDGVIADTVEYHYLATKQVADELGIPFDRELNQKMQGMSRAVLIDALLENSSKPYSLNQKKELGARKNENYQRLIRNLTRDDLLPGMFEFLEALQRNRISMAIASASSNAKTVLENLNITHYFDYVVDVRDVRNMKPDPEIFLKAAKALKVPEENCIAIEDSEAGIKALLQTKMFSIGVGSHPVVQEANWHVESTEQLSFERLQSIVNITSLSV